MFEMQGPHLRGQYDSKIILLCDRELSPDLSVDNIMVVVSILVPRCSLGDGAYAHTLSQPRMILGCLIGKVQRMTKQCSCQDDPY